MKIFSHKPFRYTTIALSALVVLASFVWYTSAQQVDKLSVDVLNIGQGDAIVIQTPYHQSILIDGGPSSSVLEALGSSLPFFDNTLDMVILTHPHADHVVGLVSVLKRYHVNRIVITGVLHTDAAYLEFLRLVKEQHIPTDIVWRGKQYDLGDGLSMQILAPVYSLEGKRIADLNDSSIVARLDYRKTSLLFTGDAGSSIEEEMINAGQNLKADVLKVGHHGSRYSSSDAFLQAVSASIGVISAGVNNQYRHPHKEALDRLKAHVAKLFRTDKDGTVHIESDGNTITTTSSNH